MTITYSSLRVEMEEIILEINKRAKHVFIEKYVNIPEASQYMLQLFNLSLYHASVPKSLRNLYCVTAGLIQLGLDLHENISNHAVSTEKNMRNRQLSVLAGDYYSSQYYYLLSKNNLTAEVKKLAKAISNINVSKMKLYTDKSSYSLEEAIKLFKIKDSNLFVQFLDLSKTKSQKEFWQFVIENIVFLMTISSEINMKKFSSHHFSYYLVKYYANNEEKKEMEKAGISSDANIKVFNLYRKYDIQRKLEDMYHNIYHELEEKINTIEDRLIQNELYYILTNFNNVYQFDKAVEKI